MLVKPNMKVCRAETVIAKRVLMAILCNHWIKQMDQFMRLLYYTYDAGESAHSHSLVSVTAVHTDRAKMLILMLERSV